MFALGIALSLLVGVSLGFFGGGGSILTVPLLVYVFSLSPKESIASSLLIVGAASLCGSIQHARIGNVRPKEGLVFGLAGMLGAYTGGRASAYLDGGLLLLLFAAIMLLTSAAMWRGRGAPVVDGSDELLSPVKLALQGFAVGSFTGLVGAGGGFLIVPALALWAGLPMAAAIGTSLFIIALTSGAGFFGYSSHVTVDYSLVGVVSAAAIAGSFLGSHLATLVEAASLKRAFAGFIAAMATLILAGEATLVVATLAPALPTTWPQGAFAVTMLVLGALTGRSSSNAERTHRERVFTQGAGI